MTLKTFPGYSPLNFPHLVPALEFDDAIIEFSGSLKDHGLPTKVTSMDDVELLLDAFHDYIQQFNFWQYYVLDVKKEKEVVKVGPLFWRDQAMGGT
jgi:glycogen debranching enzyme